MQTPKVVAVVLAHNEEAALRRTLQILNSYKGNGLLHNIIVVNDGSTDITALVAKNLHAQVINQPHQGKRGGFITAAFAARDAKADAMVLLDADIIRLPEKTLRNMIGAVTTGKYFMATAQQYEQFAPKSAAFNRVHYIGSNAQRAFNIKGLEPLFRKNKKWMQYLTDDAGYDPAGTSLGKAKLLLERYGDAVPEKERTRLEKHLAVPEAPKWGLETALELLIPQSKRIWLHEPKELSKRIKPHESRVYTRQAFGRVGANHAGTNINERIETILADQQEGGRDIIFGIQSERISAAREMRRKRNRITTMKKIKALGRRLFR